MNENCRICLNLSESDSFQSLFTEQTFDNEILTFSEIIGRIFSFDITPLDGLPSKICQECMEKVQLANSLRQQIMDSDVYLKSLLSANQTETNLSSRNETNSVIVAPTIKLEIEMESESCEICGKLVSKSKYYRHMRCHKEFPFLCAHCDPPKRFKTEENLTKHMRHHPTQLDPEFEIEYSLQFGCSTCDRTFKSKSKLEAHEKLKVIGICSKEPNELNRKCYIPECEKFFDSMKVKYEHVKNDHANVLWSCQKSQCQFKTRSSIRYEKHCKFHEHGFEFTCCYCAKYFHSRFNLTMHMKAWHSTKTENYECDVCGAKLKFKQYMKKHLQTVHMLAKPYKCSYCPDKAFTSQSGLGSHLYSQHNVKAPIYCSHCNQPFTFVSELNYHLKKSACTQSKHERKRTKRGESCKSFCEICQKEFKNATSYRRHYIVHHSSNHKYKCNICEKIFAIRSALESHLRSHNPGDKAFKCRFCSKEYSDNASLYKHKRAVHTDRLTEECDICSKRFFGVDEVMKHKMRMHNFKTVNRTETLKS